MQYLIGGATNVSSVLDDLKSGSKQPVELEDKEGSLFITSTATTLTIASKTSSQSVKVVTFIFIVSTNHRIENGTANSRSNIGTLGTSTIMNTTRAHS
jgi:hypothetical protein